MREMKKHLSAASTLVGYNVVGTSTAFEAPGNGTAFVWGSPDEKLPFPDGTFEVCGLYACILCVTCPNAARPSACQHHMHKQMATHLDVHP